MPVDANEILSRIPADRRAKIEARTAAVLQPAAKLPSREPVELDMPALHPDNGAMPA